MSLRVVCPIDRSELTLEGGDAGEYVCERCTGRYPIVDGVVRFVDEEDEFYEGRSITTIKYAPRSETWYHTWPLWLISNGYVWAVRQQVPEGRTVVELGCGSGVTYFARRYRLVGLDLSHSSLRQVAGVNAACLQADATQTIPLPDRSVDAIISSYFWEHIAPELKPKVLAECRRVLVPHGSLIFLYDLDSRNLLYRYLIRRDPELFRETLIEREGHFGWQTAEENRAIFESNGFRLIANQGREKTPFIQAAMYDKVMRWGGWTERGARVGYNLSQPPLFHFYNGALRLLDATLGRMLPLNWSRVVISVCEKQT
jgi:SAM-dependent methyltransferase